MSVDQDGAKHAGDAAPASRETYRHGDLRRALLAAGIDLARAGGPEAVVLREATRRAGVVPNAAYRHFKSRDDLLRGVRAEALAGIGQAMGRELAAIDPAADPQDAARGSLRAIGTGYLAYAFAEPGLFRAAFALPDLALDAEPDEAAAAKNPLRLLGDALDAMVAAGLLPAARRAGAEYLAWSSVHGLALLIIDGPLKGLPDAQRQAIGQRLIDMVERGL